AALASAELESKIAYVQRMRELASEAYVEVSGTLYPGTRVQVGPAIQAIDSATSSVRFRFDPVARGVRAERYVR
ncbi:MAG TPA: hypothetical protein VFZ61_25195, partial [Polyangiales bacterium]